MATRPQTMYGLADSPIDLAAFAIDHGDGTDQPGLVGEVLRGHSVGDLTRDDILDNITLYWLTNTGVSAARLYWENEADFFDAKNITIPFAISVFPDELYQAPRSWAERAYPNNLIHYNRLDRGGHFAAWEQPAALLRRDACLVQIASFIDRCARHASRLRIDHPSVVDVQERSTMSQETPTVVLAHGAFADGSSWNGVIQRLHAKGVKVTAPANPLRGIRIDSAYTASAFAQTTGPVLAVGHSYGGAVITNAASEAKNVVGLVYVAAFAPEEGELLGDASAASKDSILGSALVPRRYPTANGDAAVEFTVDPEKIHEVFAADLPDELTPLVAATQRPVAELAFSEPNGAPAWKDLPSWAVVALSDKAAGTDVVRSMAERAGATINEVEGSHVIMISQPDAVTDVILDALATVKAPAAVG